MPYSFLGLSADLVGHGWRQGGGGVRALVMGENLLHLPASLGCQPPEGVLLTGVIAKQVGADIIEGPLGMANLAVHGVPIGGMGRVPHHRDCVAHPVSPGLEEVLAGFHGHIGGQGLFQALLEMAILTADGM